MKNWQSSTLKTLLREIVMHKYRRVVIRLCCSLSGRFLVIRGEEVLYSGNSKDKALISFEHNIQVK